LNEALRIKPNNQAAFSMFFWYHFFGKRFKESIDYFLEVDVKELVDQGLFFLDMVSDFDSDENADAFYRLYQKYPHYSSIIARVGFWHLQNGNEHKAYSILKEAYLKASDDINILSGLSLVCITLNKPQEAEGYCSKGIDAVNTYKGEKKIILQSHLKDFKAIWRYHF
jgi:hypothetical protein